MKAGDFVLDVPDALWLEVERVPDLQRRVAFKIATADTIEQRQFIWLHVPARWRDDVAVATSLILGAQIGVAPCAKFFPMLDQVPKDLRQRTFDQAIRVVSLGGPFARRSRKP